MSVGNLSVLAVLVVLVAGSGPLVSTAIPTKHADYAVAVKPDELGDNDQVLANFEIRNKRADDLEALLITSVSIDGTHFDSQMSDVTVGPHGSETVTHATKSIVDEWHKSVTLRINVFETAGENIGQELTIRPEIPPADPPYLAAATLFTFSLFALLVLGFERIGVRTWVNDNPFKSLLGVLTSIALGLSNEWVWNFYGFLNDHPFVTISVSVFGILTLSVYINAFVTVPRVAERTEPIT